MEELNDNEIVEDEIHSLGGKLFTCNWMQQFPKLEKIFLVGCSSLHMLFDLQEYSELVGQAVALLFPQMKEMMISGLSKLRHVWGNVPHNVQAFENLRSLTIYRCNSLRYVFTPSIVRALKHLEKVEIRSCELMKELVSIGIENNRDAGDGKEKEENVVFAKLIYLDLDNLPRLASFCSDSHFKLVWPCLRELRIDSCGLYHIEIENVTASAKHNNLVVSSNIEGSTVNSTKSSMKFLNCCFGCANRSSIKVYAH